MTNEHNRMNRQWSLLAILALMLAVIAPAEARKYPDVTEEGLERVEKTKADAVYVAPGADFSGYDAIWLDTASVSFRKNWQRDQNRGIHSISGRVSDEDMQAMREGLAELFREVFTEELTAGGYQMVEAPGDNVLRIKPAIIDLNVNAPDTNTLGNVTSYTESAGEMTLHLELFDANTGALIAKAMDHRKDPNRGYFQWQTTVTNRQAAKRILATWAKTLREGLDEARANGG